MSKRKKRRPNPKPERAPPPPINRRMRNRPIKPAADRPRIITRERDETLGDDDSDAPTVEGN